MSKTNTWEDNVLKLLFHNAAAALIGDSSGLQPSGTAGSFYISLHTSDPGEAGDQTTNEATFTSYARVAVARSSGQWTFTAGDPSTIQNTNAITFPACTGGSNTITHFGVGTASSGTGKLLYKGALTASLAVSNGITPQFGANQLTVSEN